MEGTNGSQLRFFAQSGLESLKQPQALFNIYFSDCLLLYPKFAALVA